VSGAGDRLIAGRPHRQMVPGPVSS
jgi:hypothetical protein